MPSPPKIDTDDSGLLSTQPKGITEPETAKESIPKPEIPVEKPEAPEQKKAGNPKFTKEDKEEVVLQLMSGDFRFRKKYDLHKQLTITFRSVSEREQAAINQAKQKIATTGDLRSKEITYRSPGNDQMTVGERSEAYFNVDGNRAARLYDLYYHIESINSQGKEFNPEEKWEWLFNLSADLLDHIYLTTYVSFKELMGEALTDLPGF
jgi:hypothetical protein